MNANESTIYEYTLEAIAMPRFTDSKLSVSMLSYIYTIFALPLLISPLFEGFHVAMRYG